jgi:large subunit ribosomal protein L9
MEVILLKDLDSTRKADNIINVKPGYARNYLIPNGIALVANQVNKKILAEKMKQSERKKQQLVTQAQTIVNKLQTIKITIPVKAREEGKLFGSVSALQVSEALDKYYNIQIDSKDIIINEAIKELGTYNIVIKVAEDITTETEIAIVNQGSF